jgi:secondary thiamine-phosphate synthase enzyme
MSEAAPAPVGLARHALDVATPGRGLVDLTARLDALLAGSAVAEGLANLYCHHTSCSLIIGENADPTVLADLERWFARLVPDGDRLFRHDAEGPDDMPAHVRSVLTASSLAIPVRGRRLDLGAWQGVFLWEHRLQPHRRRLTLTVIGGPA